MQGSGKRENSPKDFMGGKLLWLNSPAVVRGSGGLIQAGATPAP